MRRLLAYFVLSLSLGFSVPALAQVQAPVEPSQPAQPAAFAQTQNTSPMFAAPVAVPSQVTPHALALRARWVTVPGWSIASFLTAHTQLNDGWSVGMEYLYRRAGFDVVLSVDYSWLEAASGNFLGKGNTAATETHFTRFDKLSSLSFDASLIGHWNLTSWLELRVGAGLGIGYVIGNIYQITNNSGCTDENAGDSTKCYPKNVGPIEKTDSATIDRLNAAGCPGDNDTLDTPTSPCQRSTQTYPFNPRVVPVLNTLIGLRFKLQDHVYWHLDGGWRLVGFYVGGGPEFRF